LREKLLTVLVCFGAVLFLSTEILSCFGLLSRWPLTVVWGAALACLIRWRPALRRPALDPFVALCVVAVAGILFTTGLTAAFSPPNSADAMAYHMPRVVFWSEQGSVRFFPTAYFNQIMLQPFAEYLMLHTYVLTGGDRLINFVQWFASAASIVAVSYAAKLFGADARRQALAALFCATIPSGILASSGAKNDYFLAMWLIIAVCFGLRFRESGKLRDSLYLGAALGFALLTKGTAYLFAPCLLFVRPRKQLLFAAAVALAINTPQYARNYDLSGSILGFDSAQGDGVFRWRNERFGWRETASNAIRNTSDQLGARSKGWNDGVYGAALAAHRAIGADPNDPATTWRWSSFAAPVNANHEANAPNRWHLALLILMLFAIRDRPRALYACGLAIGFVLFCGYLKWQPFFSRLLLPLFVLGAPLPAGFTRRVYVQIALCLFLLDSARAPLFENWVRPLKGANSVLRAPREMQYFADMGQWRNRDSYLQAVDMLRRNQCGLIGIDITNLQLEYPIEALLHRRFVHVGVANASSKYAPPVAEKPCAVVCLDCVGDTARARLYSAFPRVETAGKFLVFTGESD
jgi:hypothetical protein